MRLFLLILLLVTCYIGKKRLHSDTVSWFLVARQKVTKNKLLNLPALWYIHNSYLLLTYFSYEVRMPPHIHPLLWTVLKFQRNTGDSCSPITPIHGAMPCKCPARGTLHPLSIQSQSAEVESATGSSQCKVH